MFNNPGKKIKVLAQMFFWIDFLGSLIGGIVLIALDYTPVGWPMLLGSFVVPYFLALLFVGFGELVENSTNSKNKSTTEKEPCESEATVQKSLPKKKPEEDIVTTYTCAEDMLICPNCGIEQSRKNKYCWSCDAPLK